MVWKLGADEERNAQDVAEKHVFTSLTPTATGAKETVSGNATGDMDVPVLVTGQIHNMPDNTNAEVFILGNGSDTGLKMAVVTGPRDKQYQSKKSESWGQDPLDPNARVGYTPNGVRFAAEKKTIAEALTGMFEIDVANQIIYFRVPVHFKIPPVVVDPPAFKP